MLQLYIIFIFLCILLHPRLGHEGLHILGQSVGRVITEFTLEPVLKRSADSWAMADGSVELDVKT